MKIPFNIKYRPQIESGEYKVETRYGCSARIVCWDRAPKEGNPKDLNLCVLIEQDGGESIYYYHTDGTKWVREECFDLFIVTPEEELTEFELEVSDIVEYCKEHGGHVAFDYAKRHAKTLLAIAKKELARQGEVITLDSLSPYDKGFQDGKAEALKDLPRWKKDKSFETEGTFMDIKGRGYFVVKDGYSISVAELIKKLPGFKEDKK